MSAEDSQNSAGNVNAINDQLERLNVDGEAADATPRTEQEYAESQLTLRAIVSSKEAGVIIGKSGKNVADLRDETGVRAGVSKVVQEFTTACSPSPAVSLASPRHTALLPKVCLMAHLRWAWAASFAATALTVSILSCARPCDMHCAARWCDLS